MTDEELLRSCLRGDVDEYHKIVERYRTKALAIAMNILGNREDAEDASQDTFIQVYKNLERFDFQRSFPNWFYSILYKRCLDRLRKRRRFSHFYQKFKTEPSQSLSVPHASPKFSLLDKQELLKFLKSKERISLFLWANEGYTSHEIADVLKCSPSTARVHLFKARKKIKTLLESKNVAL
ncbi:MAG: RNA polymerase sigma factor [Candidatus Aminicenantes bacterium]|nr:MAG: RNA polymerase sigma factor [Candidatus Aminicenantes bacterium]